MKRNKCLPWAYLNDGNGHNDNVQLKKTCEMRKGSRERDRVRSGPMQKQINQYIFFTYSSNANLCQAQTYCKCHSEISNRISKLLCNKISTAFSFHRRRISCGDRVDGQTQCNSISNNAQAKGDLDAISKRFNYANEIILYMFVKFSTQNGLDYRMA